MQNLKKTFLIQFAFLVLAMPLMAQNRAKEILKELCNPKSKTVLVAAHRAGHNGFPENSISAWKHAIEIGVDIIETDVKVTRDSVVVLMHDGKIDRTTTGKGNPENYTYAELLQFKLKMPDGKVTNESITTLEEALKVAKGKVLVDIDIKTSNLKPVIDVIKKSGTQEQVFYFDNDYVALQEIRRLQPGAMLMPRAYNHAMADSALNLFSPQVVHIDESFYTAELTSNIRNKNSRVWINALGKPDDLIRKGEIPKAMNQLLIYDANIIQTDEPEKMIPWLKKKGLRKF